MRNLILATALGFCSVAVAQESQWADPLPDPEGWTSEETATNWTGHLQSEVEGWPDASADLRAQIHNLTTSCVELGNQALSDDALDALIAAVDELLWADIYLNLAEWFNDQAVPLVASAAVAVEVESWAVAINYCSQAYPWLNSRAECGSYAAQRIEAAAAAYYEAELANNPEGVDE
jgi:hypothetical protein